ncbi:MAG: AbrB/MazE/SpoVT family DNA-binding domain-containing protein [Chloroflexi bacterium]|nr:AbrB/MazE/SpoVT family DNA-binding domain-containing protein [Chloroflexota bacterium]
MNVKLSQKGWIVIPAVLRKKYGLEPGADLQVVDYGGVLSIVPAMDDPIKAGAGMLKGTDSLTEAIVEEHRQERERDS